MTQKTMQQGGQTVVGVFEDVDSAQQAINDLKVAGFTPDSISVVTRDKNPPTTTAETDVVEGNEAGQGTLVGSLGGGTLGAVLGWLLAGGTALIPGIGPVVAAGVFGATVSGALIGGALGGISGALAGAGVPETEATEYEEHVRGGRTLVTVNTASSHMLENAVNIFDRNGAVNTRYYDATQPGAGRTYKSTTTTTTTQPITQDYATSGTVTPAPDYTTTPSREDYTSRTTTTSGYDTTGQKGEQVIRSEDMEDGGNMTRNAGGYTTNQTTTPSNDPSQTNRTIYAEGRSDIADPQEFDQRTRRATEQARREVAEHRASSGVDNNYDGMTQDGIYSDPTLDGDLNRRGSNVNRQNDQDNSAW